jgi:hypothetical protein
MRVMKFAVVLGFTAALVALGIYPHPVTVHGAAHRALPRFTDGSGPVSTSYLDTSAVICANCHSTINHISSSSWDAIEIECEDCHGTGGHGMVGATLAYHTSIGAPESQACTACHNQGGMEDPAAAYYISIRSLRADLLTATPPATTFRR